VSSIWLARIVRLAAVIYLAIHGVPVGAADPSDLAQSVVRHLAAQVADAASAALRAVTHLT
jgi:hypothetical protein